MDWRAPGRRNSDRAAAWEADLRHVKGAGAEHIMELFLQAYFDGAS